MKTNVKKTNEQVRITEAALLTLVSSKLKDRILFPKKVEEAKKYLQNVKVKAPLKIENF